MLFALVAIGHHRPSLAIDPDPKCEQKSDMPHANWIEAGNTFAWQYFRNQSKVPGASKSNFAFSPSSLSSALQMLLLGADSETSIELRDALSAHGLSLSQLMPNAKRMSEKFEALEGGVNVRAANSIWVHNQFKVNPQYMILLSALGKYLKVENRDFGNPSTVDEINAWIRTESTVIDHESQEKKPLMDKILDELDPDAVMAFLTTLVVDSFWREELKEDTALTFLGTSGGPETVWASTGVVPARHYSDDYWEVLSLPFSDPSIVVDFVMPKAEHDAEKLLEGMTAKNYARIVGLATEKQVKVTLPKLDIETKVDLTADPVFRNTLGINRIFEEGHLATIGSEQLRIAQARHDSRIKMNGKGYQGFSATVLVSNLESAFVPAEDPFDARFTADRPYWMIVRDARDGQILQMTRVANGTDKLGGAYLPQPESLRLADTTLRNVERARFEEITGLKHVVEALLADPLFTEGTLPSLAAARIGSAIVAFANIGRKDLQELFYELLSRLYGGEELVTTAASSKPDAEPVRLKSREVTKLPADAPVRNELKGYLAGCSLRPPKPLNIYGILLRSDELTAALLPKDLGEMAKQIADAPENTNDILNQGITAYDFLQESGNGDIRLQFVEGLIEDIRLRHFQPELGKPIAQEVAENAIKTVLTRFHSRTRLDVYSGSQMKNLIARMLDKQFEQLQVSQIIWQFSQELSAGPKATRHTGEMRLDVLLPGDSDDAREVLE